MSECQFLWSRAREMNLKTTTQMCNCQCLSSVLMWSIVCKVRFKYLDPDFGKRHVSTIGRWSIRMTLSFFVSSISKMAAPVKLDRLRSLMSQPKNRVNAYLVYSEDAHQVIGYIEDIVSHRYSPNIHQIVTREELSSPISPDRQV